MNDADPTPTRSLNESTNPDRGGSVGPDPRLGRTRPINRATLALGTGGHLSFFTPATATPATLIGVPLAYGLRQFQDVRIEIVALVALWIIGIPICRRCAELLGDEDPRAVVYDEYVTLPWVYLGAPRFDFPIILVGFALHRFFDIVKPFGIRRLQSIGGGTGIMIDDLVAALISLALMQLAYRLNTFG
jgi:phosphatidylglycerophosphatase A